MDSLEILGSKGTLGKNRDFSLQVQTATYEFCDQTDNLTSPLQNGDNNTYFMAFLCGFKSQYQKALINDG